MTKPKKKPKTGDVVGWAVVNRMGGVYETYVSRADARRNLAIVKVFGKAEPYRIAQIVIAK